MYRKRHEKKWKYLYFGLLTAAAAVFTLAASVYGTLTGDSAAIQTTGYLSFIMWSVSAFLSLKVYFDAKKAAEERLENITDGTL